MQLSHEELDLLLETDLFPGHPDFQGPLLEGTETFELRDLSSYLRYETALANAKQDATYSGKPLIVRYSDVELLVEPGSNYPELRDRFRGREFRQFSDAYDRDYIKPLALFYDRVSGAIERHISDSRENSVLSIGAGTGFELESAFQDRHSRGTWGVFLGVDPSSRSLRILEKKAEAFERVVTHTRIASAHSLKVEEVRQDIINTIGLPTLVTCIRALNEIDATNRQPGDDLGARLIPMLRALKNLTCSVHGTIIIADLYFQNEEAYQRYAENFRQSPLDKGSHEPVNPKLPEELLMPKQVGYLLERSGFLVNNISYCHSDSGVSGYVIEAVRPVTFPFYVNLEERWEMTEIPQS
ncbi:MAG: hypothetical protein H6619_02265 [Deltaproteobacteria bacterium]|nr:hypothetical protein [Deltaproteobacteria bacterium]